MLMTDDDNLAIAGGSKNALEEFFEGKNMKPSSQKFIISFRPDEKLFLYHTATLGSKQIRSAVHNHIVQINKNNYPPYVTPKKLYDANLSPQKKFI